MNVEQLTEADEDLVAVVARLLPQLTEARTPPTLEKLQETVSTQQMLVVRDDEGAIIGMTTLVLYRVSSGLKGRIEDVIVDESARGPRDRRRARARGDAARVRGRRAHAGAELDAVPAVGEPALQAPRLRPQADERLRLVAPLERDR